jgi:hypothetical protein
MNIRALVRRIVRCCRDITVRVPSSSERGATHGQWSKRPGDGVRFDALREPFWAGVDRRVSGS